MNKTLNYSGEEKKYNYWLSTIVCLCAGMYYLYEFVLQISPNVMVPELMQDFHVGAADLGFISGAYYLAYTFMQIPAGILYDRFGPRTLLTVATLVCAMGAMIFGHTGDIMAAKLGRFLIGGGSAFAFIGCLVLVSRWFPAKYFALLAGMVQLMSSAGALIGEAPLAAAVNTFGWRPTVQASAIFGLFLAFIIWLVVRDSPDSTIQTPSHHFRKGEWKRLAAVCKKPQTWIVGIYSLTTWAPILVFASLWGVPYLTTVYGVSSTMAASAVSMVWLSIGLGSPFIGWFSDKIGRRCLPLSICSTIGLISSLIIIYLPDISFKMMFPLLFFFGFAASAQALSFGLVKDNNKPSTVGTAIGFNNMMVVCSGFFLQPLVGYILHTAWDGSLVNNIPAYSANDYRTAFLIIPVVTLLGMILSIWFIKESHCAPTYKKELLNEAESNSPEAVSG